MQHPRLMLAVVVLAMTICSPVLAAPDEESFFKQQPFYGKAFMQPLADDQDMPASTHPLLVDPRNQPGTSMYGALEPERPSRAASPELHDSVLTSWRCTRHVMVNVSCLFHNLYFQNNRLYVVLLHSDNFQVARYFLTMASLMPSIDIPHQLHFNTVEEAAVHMRNFTVSTRLALGVAPPWHDNFGHCIFDGLYPTFLGLVEFGLHHETFDAWFCQNLCQPSCDTEEIIHQFSGGRFLPQQVLRHLYPGETEAGSRFLKLSHFVYGARHKSQRVVLADGGIAGGRSLNAMYHFTRRMYHRYGLPLPLRKAIKENSPFRVAVIHNKRFNESEVALLKGLAQSYRASESHIKLTYLDYGRIQPFSSQLAVLATIDCYITSGGTGLMPHVFLPEGAIVINLGECKDQIVPAIGIPLFMEQYMAEGAPYQRALYYDSVTRCQGLEKSKIEALIMKAYKMRGFETPVPAGSNLSPEGKIFIEMCKRTNETYCNKFLDDFNAMNDWMEYVVYETRHFYPQRSQIMDYAKQNGMWADGERAVDRNLLAKIKEEYKDQIAQIGTVPPNIP
eukprot:m.168789 g.168789  ORF g.168789 m.168789 type:complete len:562 (-) comp17224_c0_seq10:643-2328(-)